MYGQIKIPPEKNAPQSLHGEDQGAICSYIAWPRQFSAFGTISFTSPHPEQKLPLDLGPVQRDADVEGSAVVIAAATSVTFYKYGYWRLKHHPFYHLHRLLLPPLT